MTGYEAAGHARMAAARHWHEGRKTASKFLGLWDRWLLNRVLARPAAYAWLVEHFGGMILKDWGDAIERQAEADEVSKLMMRALDPDKTPVAPPPKFRRG